MSFPGSNKAKYYIDTTSQQREFINAITLGEKYWSEDNFVESRNSIIQVSLKQNKPSV